MTEIKRIKTGINELDKKVLNGGIPAYSVNIIGGLPGSGKTIFTQQILFSNASPEVKTIYFTTVSEPTAKLIHYQRGFKYFDEQKVKDGLVIYVDIGHIVHKSGLFAGIEAITKAIDTQGASIVAIDSFKALNELADSPSVFRQFAYGLCVELIAWRCTSFLVGEYTQEALEQEPIFAVADGIITLEQKIESRQNKRFLHISKMRGINYFEGIHPFKIQDEGIIVFPRTKTPPQLSFKDLSGQRVSTGVTGLDQMLFSGLPIGSATLLSGGTGTGKTTLGLHFLMAGVKKQEPGVMASFEESPEQLQAVAKGFGWDLKELEDKKLLKIIYTSPVELNLDEHSLTLKKAIDQIGAKRVVIDSITDMEIETGNPVRHRDHIYSLVNFFKYKKATSLLINEIGELFEVPRLSDCGVSCIADNAILLSYIRTPFTIKRAITVLKVRGSDHVKDIKEFVITSSGLEVIEEATFNAREKIY